MYPIEYKVTVWIEEEEKNKIYYGITFGENYTEAMAKIEDYYGKEIIDVKLFMNEEGEVFEFENLIDEAWHGFCKVENNKITEW